MIAGNKRPTTWGPWSAQNTAAMWYERTPKWKLAEIAKELAVRSDGSAWFAKIKEAEKIIGDRE